MRLAGPHDTEKLSCAMEVPEQRLVLESKHAWLVPRVITSMEDEPAKYRKYAWYMVWRKAAVSVP